MSLNYDLLQALVELVDNDDISPKLKYAMRDKLNSLAVDVTRELLRIRGELEEILRRGSASAASTPNTACKHKLRTGTGSRSTKESSSARDATPPRSMCAARPTACDTESSNAR